MICIPDTPDCRKTFSRDVANLTGRQTELRVPAFFCHQLNSHSGTPGHLAALAGSHFDIVDERARRYVRKRHRIADLDLRIRSRAKNFTHLHAFGGKNIAPLPIEVLQQHDPGGAVGIILY